MKPIFNQIETQLFQSKNEEIHSLLFTSKEVRKRSINIFIFFLFIVMIGVYATLNLLLMFFTILLFVYWIAQVEFLSLKKQYKDAEKRPDLYFNKAQMLIHRRKLDACLNVYQSYQMKAESSENMKLYYIALFLDAKFRLVVDLFSKLEGHNKVFYQMYKYSLFTLHEHDVLLPILDQNDCFDLYYGSQIQSENQENYQLLYQKMVDEIKNT